jgi:hypothetical protein
MVHFLRQCMVYIAWCIFWDSVRYILHGAYFGTVCGIYCMVHILGQSGRYCMVHILGQCIVYIARCIFGDSLLHILHSAYFGTLYGIFCMVHILGQCTVYFAW